MSEISAGSLELLIQGPWLGRVKAGGAGGVKVLYFVADWKSGVKSRAVSGIALTAMPLMVCSF